VPAGGRVMQVPHPRARPITPPTKPNHAAATALPAYLVAAHAVAAAPAADSAALVENNSLLREQILWNNLTQ